MNREYQHKARKRFGQNFLIDDQIIHRIISAIKPRRDDHIVEIGPGQGAITAPILELCNSLQAIELDYDLAALLEEKFAGFPNFKLYQADALTFDFAALSSDKPLRIVGNLPYNISTPLLFHLLDYLPMIRDMYFMLQKEVVERMAAAPATKDYGRLSVIVQYYCHVDNLFIVPPGAFKPAPKVESAIVRLIPREQTELSARNENFLRTVVKTVFQQRRKTLRNSLKQLPFEVDLSRITIDLSLRPEALEVNDFVTLANELEIKK